MFRRDFARCPLDGTALRIVDGEPLVGQTLVEDRYQIEACIGEGGMGQVYRAKHTRMSRRFAIKVLYGDLAADSTMRARFKREADAAARLAHPNIVSVFDFGHTPEGLLYIAMEYVDGLLLADLIRRDGPFPLDRAMHLCRQLAAGLDHAHSQGLIHRDFKPDNVMVTRNADGEIAKILDFGIARVQEESESGKPLTTQGTLMGTPAFMSPEQALGAAVDARTDLYSLGVTLYEMATGRLPFDGDAMGMLRQSLALDPPVMSNRVPGLVVDPQLEATARKLMARSADNRYQSARELITEIDEWWVPPRVRRVFTPSGGLLIEARDPLTTPELHADDFEEAPTWDAEKLPPWDIQRQTTSVELGAAIEPTPVRVREQPVGRRRRVALASVLVAGAGLLALLLAGMYMRAGSTAGAGTDTDIDTDISKDSRPIASARTPGDDSAKRETLPPSAPSLEEGGKETAPEHAKLASSDTATPAAVDGPGQNTDEPSPKVPAGDDQAATTATGVTRPSRASTSDRRSSRSKPDNRTTRSGKDDRVTVDSRSDGNGSATSKDKEGPGATERVGAAERAGKLGNAEVKIPGSAATEPAPPTGAPPAAVSPEQFRKRYKAVFNRLDAFRRAYPESTLLGRLEREFGTIDSLNISDAGKRERSYGKLESIARQIEQARQKESR